MSNFPITSAPKDGRLIEVLFPGNKWTRVTWTEQLGGNWRNENGHLLIPGGGCMPGEWERISRWHQVQEITP